MLRRLLLRFGLAEAARRIGVAPSTLKRWVKVGVPESRSDDVARVVRRSDASRKAARTRAADADARAIRDQRAAEALERREEERARRQAAREADLGRAQREQEAARRKREREAGELTPRQKKFQESIPTPEDARNLDGDLLPDQVLPKAPPSRATVLNTKDFSYEGEKPIDTDVYEGRAFTFTVGKPAANVDPSSIIKQTLAAWSSSGFAFCRVLFLFFRFIPFNPFYRDAVLRSKQGTWVDWWTSTVPGVIGSEGAITNAIENVFEGYTTYDDGRMKHVKGAHEAAMERVIWLEQFQVHCFSRKPRAPQLKTLRRRQLRGT